ncbi:MAG: helix-hairpin-helix domain-containing protein [Segniliparus sp.]|uniref:helix-hairpin-helix domain-containing protein n=1 Tax=Segniliparus sp. TaxID=2804064 RepID=UPI003F3A398C
MSKHDVFEEEWGGPGLAGKRGREEEYEDEEFEGPPPSAPWWSGRAAIAAALCLVGFVALGFVVFGATRDDSKAAAYPVLPSVVPPTAPAAELPLATEAREIVVSVVGAVRRPGLARLAPGARVSDALEAAGGLSPEAEASELNLAQRLEDGDQVVVGAAATPVTPALPQAQAAPPASPARRAPAAKQAPSTDSRCECGGNRQPGGPHPKRAPTSVNTATEAELDAVPGIGKGIARAIVQYRASHGRIRSLDELAKVKQVGAGRLKKLRPYLRL